MGFDAPLHPLARCDEVPARYPQAERARQIIAALDELAATEKPVEHRNVKAMKGGWRGMHRIRIGEYRAIFEINPDPDAKLEDQLLLLSVEAVGIRGGVYDG